MTGQRRYQVCQIFINWPGFFCPCCGYKLRTKPRNKKFKQQLVLSNNIKNNNKNKNKLLDTISGIIQDLFLRHRFYNFIVILEIGISI